MNTTTKIDRTGKPPINFAGRFRRFVLSALHVLLWMTFFAFVLASFFRDLRDIWQRVEPGSANVQGKPEITVASRFPQGGLTRKESLR